MYFLSALQQVLLPGTQFLKFSASGQIWDSEVSSGLSNFHPGGHSGAGSFTLRCATWSPPQNSHRGVACVPHESKQLWQRSPHCFWSFLPAHAHRPSSQALPVVVLGHAVNSLACSLRRRWAVSGTTVDLCLLLEVYATGAVAGWRRKRRGGTLGFFLRVILRWIN